MGLMNILRKRWALTTALLALTLIATAAALVKLPWTYQSTGDVVFLPSKSLGKAYGGNPYLAFSSAINEMGDVIHDEATAPNAAQALAAAGYTQPYTITNATSMSAPILRIKVTGSNAAAVQHTLTGVINEMSALLASRQSGIMPVNRVQLSVIASTPQATRQTGKQARPLLVVLTVGLLFAVAIPVLVDAITAWARPAGAPGHEDQLPERPTRG